jgi:protein ImuB
VDRLACVDVPAFPLQLLLKRNPEFLGHPTVVVDEDKPLGEVRWSNEAARRCRILPGMRYAAALSLCSDLRAGVVDDEAIEDGTRQMLERLYGFSPSVEASEEEPGVFYVDASGLDPLFPSLLSWAERVRTDLACAGFFATVVVGFSRFGTYARARARPGWGVFKTAEEERLIARRVPLERLGLAPRAREALDRLAVRTVGDLLKLDAGGLRRRFGREVHRFHQRAGGDLREPITPSRLQAPVSERLIFDFAVSDTERLTFLLKSRVDAVLAQLAARQQALRGLRLVLRTERDATGERATFEEDIRPATPTLDARQLMNLVHLRLGSLQLRAGIEDARLEADAVTATLEQVQLFERLVTGAQRQRRDLRAADRALARVRARWGDDSVVKACLAAGHLPEARFRFEPLGRVRLPRKVEPVDRRLVRRFFLRPEPLPARPRHEPDGWMLRGLAHGPVVKVEGPYVVSGGWWRNFVQREYHVAETQNGDLLWVFYDRRRRRWFLHGVVE